MDKINEQVWGATHGIRWWSIILMKIDRRRRAPSRFCACQDKSQEKPGQGWVTGATYGATCDSDSFWNNKDTSY